MLRTLLRRTLPLLLTLLACQGAQAQSSEAPPAPDFPRTWLQIGLYRINTEVAASNAARQYGLMYRKVLPENAGMLFAYPVSGQHCMWMKNTYIPLSVAFLDEHGVILNIEDMTPQTETSHCAVTRARYALEMNRGWFAKRGFKPGTKVEGIEKPLAR